MRLILIRHGETDNNLQGLLDTRFPGAPLNQNGLDQAEVLAKRLADEPIKAVYASDFTRAWQTAEPLAASLGLSVTRTPALREIDAGIDDMSTDWSPYITILMSWDQTPTNRIDEGDDWPRFEARFSGAINDIASSGVACAALVSHGAALHCWVPWAAQNLSAAVVHRRPLTNTDIIVLSGDPDAGWTAESWAGLDFRPVDGEAAG